MEFSDYIGVLRRFWRSIAAITIASLAVAAVLVYTLPKAYTAQVQVFLTVLTGNSGGDLASGANYSQNQVDSFAKVATTPLVLDPVISELQLADMTSSRLAGFVSVSVPTGTAIMQISARAADADSAAQIANAVGRSLVNAVSDLSPTSTDGKNLVRATVIAEAVPPTGHSFPQERNFLIMGLAIGLGLGLGQALLRYVLDKRIHDEDEITEITDAPIMGRIGMDPELESTTAGRASVSKLTAEDYRRLRTNLQFINAGQEGGQAFVVTSSVPGEGKTTISLNLATVLAEAGETVLLVDGDLRRPRIAKYLGLESNVGLTTVLIGKANPGDVLQQTSVPNLTVMASGAIPPNPSELLASTAMVQLVATASKLFRYIIIDSAPLLPVTDAAILARQTDGALVVATARSTTVPQLEAALESIDTAKGKAIGIVINKLRRDRRSLGGSKYGYYYEYGYYEDGTESATEQREKNGKAASQAGRRAR
ncbi:MAG: polysaccharide biosynthesis tyrosine autokinase [Propionibacteriaceae bacterium]|nr:polysaccharide biosynthesis tyrosine autokinase [Propionibacteriaceae bacterium]